MQLDRSYIERTVYNFLDWLGDVGGLGSALASAFGLASLILQYDIVSYKIVQKTVNKRKLIKKLE